MRGKVWNVRVILVIAPTGSRLGPIGVYAQGRTLCTPTFFHTLMRGLSASCRRGTDGLVTLSRDKAVRRSDE